MKQCPFCAEHLQDQAVLCRFCGASADFSKGTGAWRFNSHIKHEPIVIDVPSRPEPAPESEPRNWHLGLMLKVACLLFIASAVLYLWPTPQRFEQTWSNAASTMQRIKSTATAVRSGLNTLLGSSNDVPTYQPTYASGSGNSAHDMLLSLSEDYRTAVLAKAVVTAGKPCPNGLQTFYQGMSVDFTALWNVRCDNGRAYLVPFLADPRGSAEVIDCGPGQCFVAVRSNSPR